MTEKKKLKQRIRARMAKTGESYMTAMAQIGREAAHAQKLFDLEEYYELMSRSPVPEDDPVVRRAEEELRKRGWVQAGMDGFVEFGFGEEEVETAIQGKWKRPQDDKWLHREEAVWEEIEEAARKREGRKKYAAGDYVEATALYRTIVTKGVRVEKRGESWFPIEPDEGIFKQAEKVYLPDKTVIKDAQEEHPDTRTLRTVCRIADLSMDAARHLADKPPKLSKEQLAWAKKVAESIEKEPQDGEMASVTFGPHLPNGEMLSEGMLAALAEKIGGTVEDGRVVATLPVEHPRAQEALMKGGISVSAESIRSKGKTIPFPPIPGPGIHPAYAQGGVEREPQEVRRGDVLMYEETGEEPLWVVGETRGGILVVPAGTPTTLWPTKQTELSLYGIQSALKGGRITVEKMPAELRDKDLSDLQPIVFRDAVNGLLDNLHRGDWEVAKGYWEETCMLAGRHQMEPHPWLKKLFETEEGVVIKGSGLPWDSPEMESPSVIVTGGVAVQKASEIEDDTRSNREARANLQAALQILDHGGEEPRALWRLYDAVVHLAEGLGEAEVTSGLGAARGWRMVRADPFPPIPGPGVHTVPEPDVTWIYSPDKRGEAEHLGPGYYHAYRRTDRDSFRSVFSDVVDNGTVVSVCGDYGTATMETKTPGAPKCPKCLACLEEMGHDSG